MTLSALIRKRDIGNPATAIPAISATQPKRGAATVARIATVAVATCQPSSVVAEPDNVPRFRWLIHFTDRDPILSSFSPEVTHAEALAIHADAVAAEPYEPPPPTLEPMTTEAEGEIREWLALIEEADPATIAEVIERCRIDSEARAYFVGRSSELTGQIPEDDRRTCNQCANLLGRRCQAANRGEIAASRNYEPIRDLPRRCEGYAPKKGEPDQRSGKERWPGL